MLFFFLRQSPTAKPLSIQSDLLKRPDAIWIGAEERIFQFRTGQFQLTLANHPPKYSQSVSGSTYFLLSATTEILVSNSPSPPVHGGTKGGSPYGSNKGGSPYLWSGLVDMTDLKVDQIRKTVTARILQHGSALNSILAGKPDHPDSPDPSRRYRWHKRADQWRKSWGNFLNYNQGQRDVYFTPVGYDSLTEPSDRFALTKVWIFDTSNRYHCGGIERDWLDGTLNEVGYWEKYRHPDYQSDPATWANTALQNPPGAFTPNPDSRLLLTAFPLTDIITNLVSQYNERHPLWPLSYDPAKTVLQPPAIQTEINLLPEGRAFRYIDMTECDGNLYVVVVWHDNDNKVYPFTIYQILNGSYLSIVHEDTWISNDRRVFPILSRAHASPAQRLYFYELLQHDTGAHFLYEWKAIQIDTRSNAVQTFNNQTFTGKTEQFDYYSLSFSAGMGGETLSTTREFPSVQSLTFEHAKYRRVADKLLYSGPLILDRLALNYQDTSLARILSDLAILTDSTFFITAERKLIFKSRRTPGRTVPIPSASLNRPLEIHSRTLTDEEIPSLSVGVQIADQHKRALEEYYRSTRFSQTYTEATLNTESPDLNPQPPAHALSFGINDTNHARIQNADGLALTSVMTICARVRLHTTWAGGNQHFFLKYGRHELSYSNYALKFFYQPNHISVAFSVNGMDAVLEESVPLQDNEWHTFVFVNDGINVPRSILDDSIYAGASVCNMNLWNSSDAYFRMGCRSGAPAHIGSTCFDLTDLRLYSRALSEEEIAAYHNGGHGQYGQPDKYLLFAFHCDENSGDTLRDYSGHDRHATLHGPTWIPCDFARADAPPPPLPGDQILLSREQPSIGQTALIRELSVRNFTTDIATRTAPV